jgi:hypothetical protein
LKASDAAAKGLYGLRADEVVPARSVHQAPADHRWQQQWQQERRHRGRHGNCAPRQQNKQQHAHTRKHQREHSHG